MKFIIDRSRWLRGEGGTKSSLLRPSDGKMCCIGQACRQLGVSEASMSDVGAADCLSSTYEPVLEPLLTDDGLSDQEWVTEAYEINDAPDMSDDVREQKLKALAAKNGHEFDFVDGFVG